MHTKHIAKLICRVSGVLVVLAAIVMAVSTSGRLQYLAIMVIVFFALGFWLLAQPAGSAQGGPRRE